MSIYAATANILAFEGVIAQYAGFLQTGFWLYNITVEPGNYNQMTLEELGYQPGVEFTIPPEHELLAASLHDNIYTDPNASLDDLSDDERGRLHIIFNPTQHLPGYGPHIIKALAGADYVLQELAAFHTRQQRRCAEMVTNLVLRGVQVETPTRNVARHAVDGFNKPKSWGWVVRKGLVDQRPDNPPLFRLIDITLDDPDYTPLIRDAWSLEYRQNLFRDNPAELRQQVQKYIQNRGLSIRVRDEKQFQDISSIITHIARSNPGQDKITVGINVGALHYKVAHTLIDKGLQTEIVWTDPFYAYAPEAIRDKLPNKPYFYLSGALVHRAAYEPSTITSLDYDRLLAEAYFHSALVYFYLDLIGDPLKPNEDRAGEFVLAIVANTLALKLPEPQLAELFSGIKAKHHHDYFETASQTFAYIRDFLADKVDEMSTFSRQAMSEYFSRS